MTTGWKHDLPFATVLHRQDGIMHIHFHSVSSISSPEAHALNVAIIDRFPGQKFRMLITSEPNIKFTEDAMRYSSSEVGAQFSICEAYVVNSGLQRFLGNIYLIVHRPIAPTKLFTNKILAIEWLLEFGLDSAANAD